MNNYYLIENELDEKKVGKNFSQIGYMNPSGQTLFTNKFPHENTKFELELNEKSVKTDFLKSSSINAKGFIISMRVKEILSKYNIMGSKYYLAELKTKTRNYEYYWLHLNDLNVTKKLNYEMSVFYRTEFTFREEIIKLNSFEEYQDLKSNDKDASFGIELDRIALGDNFDHNLDLFTFTPFDRNIYISEKLMQNFINESVTGIKIKKATNFI